LRLKKVYLLLPTAVVPVFPLSSHTTPFPDTQHSTRHRDSDKKKAAHMAVTASAGADRARTLLFGLPDRFAAQTQMDMFTFVQLADWILESP
jgi:hypothetical protein